MAKYYPRYHKVRGDGFDRFSFRAMVDRSTLVSIQLSDHEMINSSRLTDRLAPQESLVGEIDNSPMYFDNKVNARPVNNPMTGKYFSSVLGRTEA